MSDYSISATITADDSGFQKAINETIKGLDEFSGAFDSMTNDVKSSFANLANQFNAIDAKAKIWGNTTDSVAEKQKALKTEINRLIDSGITPESKQIQDLKKAYDALGTSGEKSTKGISDGFAKLRDIMQGPVAAIQMAKQAMEGMWSATVGQASVMEDMTAAFTPLVGGAENAAVMIAALNKEAATTPYELEGIGNVAKQLLPVLGNDVNAVTSTFRMLGDTAGGNINKLDSITRGYVKTMNSGKVSLEALNMISDAGVPIQTQLAESMGVSVQQMYKMITAGSVSSEELTKAFQKMTDEGGLFFNGMNVASQTLSGKLSTMSDNFKQAGTAIGNIFLPVVKDIVTIISNIVGGFASWATANEKNKETLKTIAIIVGTVTAAIAAYTIATGIATTITTALATSEGLAATAGAILNAVLDANPVGLVVAGVTLLIGAIVLVAEKLGGWKILFLEVEKIALTVAKAIMDYFSFVANNVIAVINTALSAYNKVVSLVGGKQIKLLDEVDIATATGITEKIVEINDQITKEKKAKADLAIQDDKTSKSIKSNAEKEKTSIQEITKEQKAAIAFEVDAKGKALSQTVENLKSEKKAALQLAEDKGVSIAEYVDVAKKADDDILESFITMTNAQRSAALQEASDKKADAAAIASINELYDGKITEFKQTQVTERNALEDTYTKKVITEAEKRAAEEKKRADELLKYWTDTYANLNSVVSAAVSGATTATSGYYSALISKAEELKDETAVALLTAKQEAANAAQESANTFMSFGADITKFVASGFTDISSLVSAGSKVITAAFAGNTEKAVEFSDKLVAITTSLSTGLQPILAVVADVLLVIMDALEPILVSVGTLLDLFGPLIELIGPMTELYFMPMTESLKLLNVAIGAVSSALKPFTEAVGAAGSSAISGFIDGVKNTAKNIWSSVSAGMQSFLDGFYHMFGLDVAVPVLQAIGEKIVTGFINGVKNISSSIWSVIKAPFEAVTNGFAGLFGYSSFFDMGKNIVNGFINGIKSIGSTIWDSVRGVFVGFWDNVKNLFGIHSPSTVFYDIGGNIIQGMINGIKGFGANIWTSVSGTFSGLWENIKSLFSGAVSLGSNIVSGISSGISSAASGVSAVVSSAASGLSDVANTVSSAVSGAVSSVSSGISSAASTASSIASSIASGLSSFFHFASGTDYAPGGLSLIGEAGREMFQTPNGYTAVANAATVLDLPRGSKVLNNARTEALLGSGSSGSSSTTTTVNATFNSPKAMNQYEQLRQLKRYNKELAFKGAIG